MCDRLDAYWGAQLVDQETPNGVAELPEKKEGARRQRHSTELADGGLTERVEQPRRWSLLLVGWWAIRELVASPHPAGRQVAS